MPNDIAVEAALRVLQAHIDGLNARDETKLASTLHFPHYRLSGTGMKVWETPESYFNDFRMRAGNKWNRSSFEDIRVLQASEDKVHLDVEVRRFDEEGSLYQAFRSLWVITCINDRWAASLRSSFAAK